MKRKHFVVLLPAVVLLLASGLLAAQPAPGKDGRDERRQERREKREERRDQRERRQDRTEDRKDGAEDRKDRADTRRERRRERAQELRLRYGHLLGEPAVLAELKVHSRRMARLHALRRVAEKEGKTALLPRIDKLIQKEQARHQRHMDALKSRGAAAPSASASYGGAR